jgi:hypothetical protein
MLRSIVGTLRARRADLSVSMSTVSDGVVDAGERIHTVPETSTLAGFVEAIRRTRPDALVLVGADVMDGHYGPLFTARRLLAADLIAREGVPTVITGFSFNSHPHPLLAGVFDALDKRVCCMCAILRRFDVSRRSAAAQRRWWQMSLFFSSPTRRRRAWGPSSTGSPSVAGAANASSVSTCTPPSVAPTSRRPWRALLLRR